MAKNDFPLMKNFPDREVLRAIVEYLRLEFYMAVNLDDPDEAREDRERLHCQKREIS
jgi:hypothetical protein